MVSKNNRYLRDVLHVDKTQHWSLRKLGIGVTSVLLGTTFYLGGNTVAHADQTAPVAPTDNGSKVTTANPVENGNTAVLRTPAAQPRSTTSTSTAPTVASSASTAPVASASTTTGTKSVTPTSTVQNVANNATAVTSNAAQPSSTTTLNIQSGAVASQSPAVLAQSLVANDQNKAQTVWADASSAGFTNAKTNNTMDVQAWNWYGIQGNFTIDANYLKAGNTINIANMKFSSVNNKFTKMDFPYPGNVSYKGKQLGVISILQNDSGNDILQLKVTDTVQALGKTTIDFRTSDSFIRFNFQTDMHNYKANPYTEDIAFINNNNKVLNTYHYTFTHVDVSTLDYVYTPNVTNWQKINSGDLHENDGTALIPNNDALKELQNSEGKTGVTIPTTYKNYWRIKAGTLAQTGSKNVDDPYYGIKNQFVFHILTMSNPVNSSGKLMKESMQTGFLNVPSGATNVGDNLTLAEIDQSDFKGNYLAYSKQKDGTYLMVTHIPTSILKLSDDGYQSLANTISVVFDPKNTSQAAENSIIQKMKDYYNGALQGMNIGFSPYITVYYNNPSNLDTNITMDVYSSANADLSKPTASGSVSPVQDNSKVKDQAGLNIQYINVDTGQTMSNDQGLKTDYEDPGTKKSVDLPNFNHYHLVAKVNQNGNVITLGNGRTITLGTNDTVAQVNSGSKTIEVAYPGTQGQIGNVYVFYQGDDEQGEVQFVDADTKDAKGPNGYKLLETKQTNKGHYGESFNFPAGQDPETILNQYVYVHHYQYRPTDALNQAKNAYQFNKSYTYTDNSNNNQGNVYYIYLHHETKALNKTVKRTVRYINSNGTPMTGVGDQVQTITFTGSHDMVTDKDNWDPNPNNTFKAITSPTVKGYTVSQQTVPEVTGVTPTTPDDITTVVYTPVVNIKSLTVNYVDDVTGNTLQSDHFSGNEGESANYNTKSTIANYESQGYKLAGEDPTHGNNLTYDGQTYTIHFDHVVVPVDPSHPQPDYNYSKDNLLRKVSRTINYINADGKLFSTKNDSMNFVGTGDFDKVTHQLVSVDNNGKITGLGHLTWVPDKENLAAVTSPTIANQHVALITPADQADGINVKPVTFDYNSGNLMIDVYYVKDNTVAQNAKTVNVTQTVHFVNAAGQTVLPDNVQTITFNRTPDVTDTTTNKTTPGAWDKDSDTYQDVVVPTMNGYVANTKVVKGQPVNHDSKNSVVVVVYQPTGKLIPVDQHGNPIKGAPTPQYSTDPSDPTKVTDENIPNVPGYRPADGQSTTVTPANPTQNTEVHYTSQQVAVVRYIDADTGQQLATSGPIYGDPDTAINYSTKGELATLGTQGYHVIYDEFDTATPQMFDHDIYSQQNYNVLLSKRNNSQQSQGSQGSNSQQSQGSQGSNSQQSQGSQGSNSQQSQGSQGSNSQQSQGSQGSNSQQSQGSQGSNSQQSQGSQGSNSQQSQDSQDSNSQQSQGSQGSNSQQNQGSQGSNSQQSQGSQGSNSQQSQGSQGSNSQQSQGSQGSNSQQSQGSQGSNSQQSQGSQTNPNQGEQATVTITYVDQDNGGRAVKTVTVNGKPGTKLGYDPTNDVKTLEDQGYVIVKNNIPGDATFNSDPNKNNYTITVKHGTAEYGPNTTHQAGTPINPNDPNGAKWPAKDAYTKTYTDTVHFVGPDGNKLTDDNVQTSTWTRTVTVDKVTGQILNPDAGWTPDIKSYQDVQVPVVNGYYANRKVVTGQPAVQQNLESTVEYRRLGKVIPIDANGKPIPGAPTATYQNDPNDPTKGISPAMPDVPGYSATVDHVVPSDPGTDTYVSYTKNGGETNGTTNNGNQTTGNGTTTNNGGNGMTTNNGGQVTGNGANNGMATNGEMPLTSGAGYGNADLNGMATNGTAAYPGALSTTAYTGDNGQSTTTATQSADNNTTLPQTGNEAENAVALGGLSALAALGMLGAAKKRHE